MRYVIREKILSLGDNFTIKDSNENDIFRVRGKLLSLGNKLRLYSMDDSELVYIEQKLFRFLPEYHIFMNNSFAALVKKELSFLKPKLYIESTFGNYTVEGNIFAHNFQINKDGYSIAGIYKKLISFTDSYEIEISESENQAFILSLVIVIDQIFHDQKNK